MRGQETCREPPGDGRGEAGGLPRGQDEAGVDPAQGGAYGDGSGVGDIGERGRDLHLGLDRRPQRSASGGGLPAVATVLRRLGRPVRMRRAVGYVAQEAASKHSAGASAR